MTSKRDHAIALAQQGYRVFPLTPNGKTPAHANVDWTKTASSDPARVAEMWTDPVFDAERDYNIGIALDRHTLVVDIDVRSGKRGDKELRMLEMLYDELPPTRRSTTASGGKHVWLAVDGNSGDFPAKLATDIDLKGEGGYVVGPGSEIDGALYVWEREPGSGEDERGLRASPSDWRLPNISLCPEWIARNAIAGRKRDSNRVENHNAPAIRRLDTEPAVSRATDWLVRVAPTAIEGSNGDNTTIEVANRIGDFGISAAVAADLMLDHWNDTKADPPWDAVELTEKVNNAFRSRQNQIGSSAPEAEFEDVTGELDAAKEAKAAARIKEQVEERKALEPVKRGLYYIPWSAAAPDLDQPYLIDEIMDLGSMVVTYGDSNAGKTFVVLDQAFAVATGRDWNGYKVLQGLVIYVASEGGKGFQKRIAAYRKHHGIHDLPFALVPCPIDLHSDQGDTAKLVKLIREVETHFGQKCVMVVIDTLARAMGGGDENTAVDMSRFVGHCDKIRAALGATVNVIHHTGKDKARGARGSSALRAATDTEIEISPGVFLMQKQRDLEKVKESAFKLTSIEIGHRADGKPVTGCVVEWVTSSEFDMQTTPEAEALFTVLEGLVAARADELAGQGAEFKADKSDISIPWKEWESAAVGAVRGPRGGKLSNSATFNIRKELHQNGRVQKDKSGQWFIPGSTK